MVLQIISWYKFFVRRIDGLTKTSKLQLETRPTITAIALFERFRRTVTLPQRASGGSVVKLRYDPVIILLSVTSLLRQMSKSLHEPCLPCIAFSIYVDISNLLEDSRSSACS